MTSRSDWTGGGSFSTTVVWSAVPGVRWSRRSLAGWGSSGRFVHLARDRPGAANAGRKVMALIFAMVLGADCIDDCEVLRAGRTRRLLGGWLPAPSTLGTFLRAFTFGHVRPLDRVLPPELAMSQDQCLC